MSDKWIRASEINTYIYCRRAWWLERGGHEPYNVQEIEAGTAYHAEHGRSVLRATWLKRLAYALLFVTAGMILFTIFSAIGV